MKITEKVAFNIASEASYVYILSGQKFIKNAKNSEILKLADILTDFQTMCDATLLQNVFIIEFAELNGILGD